MHVHSLGVEFLLLAFVLKSNIITIIISIRIIISISILNVPGALV